MIHVVACKSDRLVDLGAVGNGISHLGITVTPTPVRLHGPSYASGDPLCCPSIKDDDGALSLSSDGTIMASGGTYQGGTSSI